MNITIFNGSHKAEKGNTFVMVEAFLPLEDFSDEYLKRVNALWDKKLS